MAQLAVVFVFVRLVLHADFVEQIAQQLNGFDFCAVKLFIKRHAYQMRVFVHADEDVFHKIHQRDFHDFVVLPFVVLAGLGVF